MSEFGTNVGPSARQEALYHQATEEFGAALGRLARAYESDPDRGRDLLQEIHLAVWRSFEKFQNKCSLRTWVYRVAHNVAASHLVRRTRRNPNVLLSLEEAEQLPCQPGFEVSVDRERARSRLLALIHLLDPADRQLMLAYLEGMDAESIAEISGLSPGNVWTRIHRMKAFLVREFHAGGVNAR
jgi:RNA polymerase sigma-70 factor (ECF subfamily)